MTREELAKSILDRLDQAAAARGQWESVWEQIAQRIFPQYVQQFVNRSSGQRLDYTGVQRTEEMVDATGALALIRFAAAMESMLTPRMNTWHGLVPSDPVLKRNREARLWYEELTRALFEYRYAPNANFASQKHEDYMTLGAFGSGCIFIDPLRHHREQGIRYRSMHLAQMFFLENHQGLIDTAMRKFTLTARQAVQQFGKGRVPEAIAKHATEAKHMEKPYEFIHCVKPRTDEEGYDPDRRDMAGMPYVSYYVAAHERKQMEERTIVQSGGYFTFPYAISRYVVAPGEMYGRSPAMMALPALKTLNEQKKTMLKQGHYAVDPVWLAHDDGVISSTVRRPGATIWGGVNAEGKPLVQAMKSGDLASGQEMMDAEKLVINDFFFVTLFQILVETPQMTATEVLERVREKGALLSPTMGRQQSESLGPMIEREIDVLMQQGLVPPMPPIVAQAEGRYTVQYNSPLSRAARAEEAAGFMRTLETALKYVEITQEKEPLDHFNMDEIIPDVADINAMPARWLNTMDRITAIRNGRQQAVQTQQMIEAAPAAASAVKSMMPMART